MTWRNPVIRHTEQLQASAGTGVSRSSASNRTLPQWQPPRTLIGAWYDGRGWTARRPPRGADAAFPLWVRSAAGGDPDRCAAAGKLFAACTGSSEHLGAAIPGLVPADEVCL